MTREEAITTLSDISKAYRNFSQDEITAIEIGVKALKAIDEIIDYLHDGSVTWRDITDDIIADIVNKHMGEQK